MTLTRTRVAVAFALIAFTFFATAINSQPHGWISWYRLASSGQSAIGTVTRTQPEIHQTCFFTFKVGSLEIASSGDGCTVPVGQTVSLTYAPWDPTFTTLRSPRDEFMSLVLAPIVMSLLGGFFAAGQWERKTRQRSGA